MALSAWEFNTDNYNQTESAASSAFNVYKDINICYHKTRDIATRETLNLG